MNYQVFIVLVPIVVFITLAILSQWKELSAEYGSSPIERIYPSIVVSGSTTEFIKSMEDARMEIARAFRIPREILEEEWWQKGDSAIFHPESEQ